MFQLKIPSPVGGGKENGGGNLRVVNSTDRSGEEKRKGAPFFGKSYLPCCWHWCWVLFSIQLNSHSSSLGCTKFKPPKLAPATKSSCVKMLHHNIEAPNRSTHITHKAKNCAEHLRNTIAIWLSFVHRTTPYKKDLIIILA